MQQAQETQQYVVASLKKIALNIENSVVIDPGIKGLATIQQLLQTRWNGDASKITDYARATIVVDSIFDVYRCLEKIYQSSLHVIEIQDNFFTPYPEYYRDVNIIVRDPHNEHIGEIQINTHYLVDFKNTRGHHMFDQIRDIKAQAYLEHRPLSREEQRRLDILTEKSREGYNQAFHDSMNIPGKKERVGIYGILLDTERKKILLTQTKSGSKIIYNFPGGGVEKNEGFKEALIR